MIILSNQLSPFYEFYAVRSISFGRISHVLLVIRVEAIWSCLWIVRWFPLVVPLGEGRISVMLFWSSADLEDSAPRLAELDHPSWFVRKPWLL